MNRHFFRLAAGMAAVLTLAGPLAGCNSINNLLESGDRIDYKSAPKNPNAGLEVPPDLTQLSKENRYSVPAKSSTTFSTYSLERGEKKSVGSGPEVLPESTEARVEKAGSQRWLVVNQPPEKLYPIVREFWQDLGFLIQTDLPEAGVLETDWAENRAKVPQDFVRNTLGRVLDSLYSTGERDKFRTRFERTDRGTEIYISHRGMQEVLNGATKEQTIWTTRNPDPELEAEFLRRLMVRLGTENEKAKAIVAAAPTLPPKAKLAGSTVSVDEPFDRAWRRVGLALDRVGFTVEDRNRQQGVYFVRYVDPATDGQAGEKKGFLSRMFSFGSSNEPAKNASQYRVAVKSEGESTQIAVQNKDGAPENSATSGKILSLLYEQLK
jgi:outer membrane protein assembly factor BamC